MNKMKRIFSFVLVFAILAGSFASFSTEAFAETATATEGTEVLKKVPSDVIGTEHEDAVRRLVAFGIIGGYPDGSYKPERVVNRAQFAKIIVEALGLRDAVPAAEGQATGFKDVAGDYWAAGYINVASGQGLIKGYPDGTFKPAREVTYAQALTMLVRALGYQDEFLKGTWPGNYVSKAADVGITSGVKIPSNAQEAAKRGYVAELVNNALDAKVVKVDTYKPNTGSVEYYETEIPLLKDKLEISKYEDTRVVADKIVDDGLDKDEVRVRFLESTDRYRNDRRYNRGEVVKKEFAKGAEETFRYYADVNPREIIGEEVTTYIDDNDKVIYVEDERDDKANFDFVEKLDNKKLELVKFDKAYDFETKKDEEAVVWVHNGKDKFELFNSERDLNDLDRDELVGRMGKVVVKNNRIVYAEFQAADDVNSEWMLVRENKDGNLMGVVEETEDFKLDLRKDKDYDYALVYNTKGEKISLKDIEEGNIIYVDEIDYDGDDVALVTVVTDNKIEGEVGRVKSDRIEIDKKEIKVVKTKPSKDTVYHASYTNDDFDEVKEWTADETWEDDMEDAYKENAVAYTDATGRIAFINLKGGNSGYKFGVVTRTYADGDRIRIFTTIDGKEGKDQIFKMEKERDLDKLAGNKNLLGAPVRFRLNSDGEIADGKFDVKAKDEIYAMTDDFGKDVIKAVKVGYSDKIDKDKAVSFVVPTDSTNVISAEGYALEAIKKIENSNESNLDGYKYATDKEVDVDDFDVTTWKDIKEDKEDSKVRFYIFTKDNKDREVEGLVFVGTDGANTGSDEIAVYVLDQWKSGDKLKVEYVSYENNEKQTREVSNESKLSLNNEKNVKKERAYAAKEKSNGKIELFGELNETVTSFKDYDVYRGVKVKRVRGNYVELTKKVNGKDEFYVSGALIYDEDKTKSVSYLEDKTIDIVADGIRARVIGVSYDSTDTKPETPSKGKEITSVSPEDGIVRYDGSNYKVSEDIVVIDKDGVEHVGKVKAIRALEKLGLPVEVEEFKTDKDGKVNKIVLKKADTEEPTNPTEPEEETLNGEVVTEVDNVIVLVKDVEKEPSKVVLNGNVLDAEEFDYGYSQAQKELRVHLNRVNEEDVKVKSLVVTIEGVEYKVVFK